MSGTDGEFRIRTDPMLAYLNRPIDFMWMTPERWNEIHDMSDPDRNPMPSAIDALSHILAWIDQRVYGDHVGEHNPTVLKERSEIRDHVAAFLEQCRGEPPQMTIKRERAQTPRPERLDTYWSWQGLQEAMREIDVDRQDLTRRQHSSGMQVVGTDIVTRFIDELDEAFYDAAEIAAAKRRQNR